MIDRTITATTAAALFLWPLGLAMILLDLFADIETGELGLYVAGMGGVLNIRGFFASLAQREREAYDLGRETVRHLR